MLGVWVGCLWAADAPENFGDQGWPRIHQKGDMRVVVNQPQLDSWKDYKEIKARAAIAVTPAAGAKTEYGIMTLDAKSYVYQGSRQVQISEPIFTFRFPDADAAAAQKLEQIVRGAMPDKTSVWVSLDRMLAYLDGHQAAQPEAKVSLDPPLIFYSDTPAILVIFMGKPKFQMIKGTSLMAASNTNWDIFLDSASSQYYLLDGESWMTAPDPIKGPWTAAKSAPAEIAKLPDDENWKPVRAAYPGKPAEVTPAVFATTTPAELIVTDGPPEYSPIAGTKLMEVTNSNSTLIHFPPEGNHYYLVAGRWFRALELGATWKPATTDLPSEFLKIPAEGPLAAVRAAVSGTIEASDAVLLASAPEMAEIKKSATIEVAYDGDPAFAPIDQSKMSYATNTAEQVIQIGNQYYCCHQGVWFISNSPNGPWTACVAVPPEIYTIPATHPMHNVTYVYIYDTDDDDITVGYTAGYLGEYVYNGVLMFGAGVIAGAIIADEWDDDDHYHYYPHYYSYGCDAHYDYGYGGYYRGATVYGPYGGAGRGSYYNPSSGTWARGGYRYGPNNAVWAGEAYNPRTDTYVARAGGSGNYGSWGRTYVQHDDEWARAGHKSTDQGSAGWIQTSNDAGAIRVDTDRREGTVAKDDDGNLYVGNDGNVYRKDDDGNWAKREDGEWNSVERPDNAPRPSANDTPPYYANSSQRPGSSDSASSRLDQARANTTDRPTTLPSGSTARTQPSTTASSRDMTWSGRDSSADLPSQLDRQASARSYGNSAVSRSSSSGLSRSSYSSSRSSTSSSSRSSSYSRSSSSSRSSGGSRGGSSRGGRR